MGKSSRIIDSRHRINPANPISRLRTPALPGTAGHPRHFPRRSARLLWDFNPRRCILDAHANSNYQTPHPRQSRRCANSLRTPHHRSPRRQLDAHSLGSQIAKTIQSSQLRPAIPPAGLCTVPPCPRSNCKHFRPASATSAAAESRIRPHPSAAYRTPAGDFPSRVGL